MGHKMGLTTTWSNASRPRLSPGRMQCDPIHILEVCNVMALGLKAGGRQCLLLRSFSCSRLGAHSKSPWDFENSSCQHWGTKPE